MYVFALCVMHDLPPLNMSFQLTFFLSRCPWISDEAYTHEERDSSYSFIPSAIRKRFPHSLRFQSPSSDRNNGARNQSQTAAGSVLTVCLTKSPRLSACRVLCVPLQVPVTLIWTLLLLTTHWTHNTSLNEVPGRCLTRGGTIKQSGCYLGQPCLNSK